MKDFRKKLGNKEFESKSAENMERKRVYSLYARGMNEMESYFVRRPQSAYGNLQTLTTKGISFLSDGSIVSNSYPVRN